MFVRALVRRRQVALRNVVRAAIYVVGGLAVAVFALAGTSLAQGQTPAGMSPAQLTQQYRDALGRTDGDVPVINGTGAPLQNQNIVQRPEDMLPSRQLPPSRLEQIMSSRAGVALQQFGYDQLGSGRAVTIPQSGAIADDYVLGPGDEIVVSLRGQENSQFRTNVDRNGQVVLPRLNPILATGRNFGSFRQDLESQVHRTYVATQAFVSVGHVRQISVLVSGEVNSPGPRIVAGLASVVDVILLSGGVKKTGSLRQVHIQRHGREYIVDLYSVLTSGGAGSSMGLADGDRILVPLLGPTVAVAGLVRRPGIYEILPRQTGIGSAALLALAGGLEVRGRYQSSVLRILPNGQTSLEAVPTSGGLVRESEVLMVQFAADQTVSQATLAGSTGLAGRYPVVTGMRLSEVLKPPGALGPSPYTPFGIIVSTDPATLMPTLLSFTPAAVLMGSEDQVLRSGDIIRVLTTNEVQLLTFVVQTYLEKISAQQDAIRHPKSQAEIANNTATATPGGTANMGTLGPENNIAKIVASQSGQQNEIANMESVPASVLRRQVIEVLNITAPGSALEQQQTDEARASARAQQQSALSQQLSARNAGVVIRDQPGQMAAPGYTTAPAINPYTQQSADVPRTGPGVDITSNFGPARNFTDQAVDSNRYASNREVETFGQLVRQLGVDPLILMSFLVESRARIDGAVRGPGYYFVGPNASLKDLVQAAGGTLNWVDESGVELISTVVERSTGRAVTRRVSMPLRQSALASYVVRPRDQLRFNQAFSGVGLGSVSLQGEVRTAGNFQIVRGDRLSDLLARAGGLTNVAYPAGTLFLRESAAQVEREGYIRAANDVQNQLIIAMTRVGNSKIEPTTFASMQNFVTELRNQRALGRVSVVADPSVLASNPALDPLLEAGDVIYIPQRPSTVSVLGQVMQPGSFPYRSREKVKDYIARAGGYTSIANDSEAFLVLPDGSARRTERSWLNFDADTIPPGSSIVIPRDITPLDLRQSIIDVSQIFSQLAVSIASVAVLSKQ